MKTNEINIKVCLMDQDGECVATFKSYDDALESLPMYKGCEIGYYGWKEINGLTVSTVYKSMAQVIENLSSIH